MNSASVTNNPTQAKETLDIADIIGVLGNEFSNIYSVDRGTQDITIFRYENDAVGVHEVLHQQHAYQASVRTYIEANVLPEDRPKMYAAMDFAHVCGQLRHVPQFTVHYRVQRDGETAYYYMKCARIGAADTFQHIVFAFANEDMDVRRSESEAVIHANLTTGRRKILIIEDNPLNREMLCDILSDQYDLLTAENGMVGFELLEKNYKELSVILLDMEMPVCSGTEFLQRIRDDALLSSVPVIVITVNNGADAELTCLNLGASDFIRKPYNADIVRGRVGNLIKLKESAQTLAAVEHDTLTGLYTEQAFLHYAKSLMQFKHNEPMHVIIAKIRDFKLLNSIYGTKKVNEALRYLASVYSREIRYGLLARKGSSSFICLLWGDAVSHRRKLDDIIAQIAEKSPINGMKVKYGVYQDIDKSLPVATICDYASMAEETITDCYDCDLAFYTQAMAQQRIYHQMLENSFEAALNEQEFVVYYQPKIDVSTEKVIGAEALVRWRKDEHTMISPGDFIPVFEKDGLIVKLDEYVFRKVCRLQKSCMEQGTALLPISVNLSRSSVLHEEVAKRYIRIVAESGLPFSCVPIELTESAAIYNDRIKSTTDQLTDAGFTLHIDDFGSGYSSLVSLNQFPFSILKIDKSLIDHVSQKNGRTLVEQVITLANLLNMRVVAEGVETREQLDIIKELHCDEVQGFFYARPMPEEEFVAYVQDH